MPKVVPEYKELAKKKIIKASYTLFESKGYHSTSMDDIAAEVGVSKASLYSYFKSKEDILLVTVDLAITEPFIKTFNENKSVDAFKDYYHTLTVFEGLLHLNYVLTSLANDSDDIKFKLIETYETKLKLLTRFVSKQQSLGELGSDLDPGAVAQFLIAVYGDISLQLIMGVDEKKISNEFEGALKLILENKKIDKDQSTLSSFF
ncbi:transcriptional regulator, TetR family [Methanobacterium lacus]|jgi:AcrR family transcriptional regulator|uniref:Transcriptional regulator, TetR family n=1 Tax=Methanobacterium lacus (strain AL-21) TaxID=877455 RepID=F0T7P8_METLA|nr:TetR/AcrR family transcriptional regulator [Methanobacterium lacus]ADZ09616.1 transcriptional regulator, TetR family [Methanobacterium lacus]